MRGRIDAHAERQHRRRALRHDTQAARTIGFETRGQEAAKRDRPPAMSLQIGTRRQDVLPASRVTRDRQQCCEEDHPLRRGSHVTAAAIAPGTSEIRLSTPQPISSIARAASFTVQTSTG